jgi:predicted  nucleic acid-binding Zn-ribbon protein
MAIHRKTGWIFPALVASTVAVFTGCATTGGSLPSAAERLERNAYELQKESRDDGARSSYSREAGQLAEEARDFRRVLQDRRSRDNDVQEAFADLSKRYHALRDEMDRKRSSRDADIEFKQVTDAYLDIEREMRKRGKDRYARD